jgi:transglutaminase-like putative cysteine protease
MLSPSAYIEASNSEIKDLSEKLNKTAEYDTAKAIFSWISPNIKSESYNGSPKSALNTLHQLQGDCTDAAHLFIALARASKIPARLVAGFYLDRDKRLRASDFHNWAEFYSENTWRIADPNLGHFDTNYTNYLAFQYPDGATEAEYITSSTRAKSNSAQVRIAFE